MMKRTKIAIPLLALLLSSNSWGMGERSFLKKFLSDAIAAGRSLLPAPAATPFANLSPKDRVLNFIYAAQQGDLQQVQDWLPYVNVNAQEPTHKACALTLASQNGHLNVVEFLLKQEGRNCNIRASLGHTALRQASQGGHIVVVKALIEEKADVAIPDHQGFLPLHAACKYGHVAIARILIEAAPQTIDACPDGITTPLHVAVLQKKVDIVTLLLEKKATPELKYRANNGALQALHLDVREQEWVLTWPTAIKTAEDENPAGPEEEQKD